MRNMYWAVLHYFMICVVLYVQIDKPVETDFMFAIFVLAMAFNGIALLWRVIADGCI